LNKGPPRKVTIEDMSDALAAPSIITPHALPMFKDMDIGRGSKRKREKERMDPRKSRRPELPVTGPGKGGRVGASATQHVVQNLVKDTTREEDVGTPHSRCCLLKFHYSPVRRCSSMRSLLKRILCGQQVSVSGVPVATKMILLTHVMVVAGRLTPLFFYSVDSESTEASICRAGARARGGGGYIETEGEEEEERVSGDVSGVLMGEAL
jgi:hypothetical protein